MGSADGRGQDVGELDGAKQDDPEEGESSRHTRAQNHNAATKRFTQHQEPHQQGVRQS